MKTRSRIRKWASSALLLVAAANSAPAQSAPGPAPSPTQSIEQDLLVRLKGQPIGQGTLDSLAVPDEFLRRVADRIIRMDYQKRYRMVLKGDAAPADASSPIHTPAPGSSPTTSSYEYPVLKRTLFGISGGAGLVILIAVVARRRRRKDRG